MKYLTKAIFLFLLTCFVHGDELIFGEPDRINSTRVSLMKLIVNPESCQDLRIGVFGYIFLERGPESALFFSKEALDRIDMGNGVNIKTDGLVKFLDQSKRQIDSSLVHVEGFVRYNPKINNANRRVWIDAKCIVFSVQDEPAQKGPGLEP